MTLSSGGSGSGDSTWWFNLLPVKRGWKVAFLMDGGGTGSRGVLVTPRGEIIGYAEAGPTNARAVGDEVARSNLVDVLRRTLANSTISASQLDACVVATAAVDTIAHSSYLTAAIRSIASNVECVVLPDGLASWAVTANVRPAIAAIAGTGSVVFAVDPGRGRSFRFGGWDYLLGDEGSGFAIGRETIRQTLLRGQTSRQATLLSDACMRGLGVDSTDEIPDIVHKPHPNKASIAALAKLVLSLADDGDLDARQVVARAASDLAELVALANDAMLPLKDLPVGCFGSIFHSTYYRHAFLSSVRDALSCRVDLSIYSQPALGGAFRLALASDVNGLKLPTEATHAVAAFESNFREIVASVDRSPHV